jgi:hypothetical protein
MRGEVGEGRLIENFKHFAGSYMDWWSVIFRMRSRAARRRWRGVGVVLAWCWRGVGVVLARGLRAGSEAGAGARGKRPGYTSAWHPLNVSVRKVWNGARCHGLPGGRSVADRDTPRRGGKGDNLR